MTVRRHVTVVGGGAVALALAQRLLVEGHSVRLIAGTAPDQSTAAGSGSMFSIANVLPLGTTAALRAALPSILNPGAAISVDWRHLPRMLPWIVRMIRHSGRSEVERITGALAALLGPSIEAFRPLIETASAHDLVRMAGHLVLYDNPAEREADWKSVEARRRAGVRAEAIDEDELKQLEPSLPRGRYAAVYFPDSGHIVDAGALLTRLEAALVRSGVEVVRDNVVKLETGGGRARRAVGAAAAYDLDVTVIAAGAWSRPLAAQLGCKLPLEPERGYHLSIPLAKLPINRPIVPIALRMGITPQAFGLRVAGTIEFSGLDRPVAEKRLGLLRRGVESVFPEVDASTATTWSGYRPTLPDWLPVIGPAPHMADAYFAFGHQHVGLTAAGITASLVSDQIAERPAQIDPAPYPATRF